MKLIEDIYIIKHILSKFHISDDNRINERTLAEIINQRRAMAITQEYAQTQTIDPIWLQDFGKLNLTKVTSSDDPLITNSTVCLGKITLPPVVGLPNKLGEYRLSSSSKLMKCYPLSAEEFFFMYDIADSRFSMPHYFRIGNAYYFYPHTKEASAILILENPLLGKVKRTEEVLSGSLTFDDTFLVIFGLVNYGGTNYSVGSTFTCTRTNGTTFTGSGKVMYQNKTRNITMYDDYPMSAAMSSMLIIDILTKEFKIEATALPDMVNDARDNVQRSLQSSGAVS